MGILPDLRPPHCGNSFWVASISGTCFAWKFNGVYMPHPLLDMVAWPTWENLTPARTIFSLGFLS